MKRFEYQISKHAADAFSKLVYFCTDEGDCSFDQLPGDQLGMLGDLLNEKGAEGWELIQLSFGKDGMVAFWKREE
jgi:hypothetical protein